MSDSSSLLTYVVQFVDLQARGARNLHCRQRATPDSKAFSEFCRGWATTQCVMRASPLKKRPLENPEIANLSDSRRAFNDQAGDELRREGARHVRRDIGHELRRHLNDEFIRCGCQAMFVSDAYFHVVFVRQRGARYRIYCAPGCAWLRAYLLECWLHRTRFRFLVAHAWRLVSVYGGWLPIGSA